MRALTLQSFGLHPSVSNLPKPEVSQHQVRVKVHATSVNPIDWKQASGHFRPLLTAKFPNFIPGYDVAGVVDAVGPGVTEFVQGQRVHARLFGNKAGANAEWVVASHEEWCAMPASMDFATAAGLPLTGLTALQALRDLGKLPLHNATQRVLILGASGGVGHWAVQLAVQAHAQVVAVCSERNAAWVKALGADAVLDHSKPGYLENQAPFHIILDCVGKPYRDFLPYLLQGGHYISCLPSPGVLLRSAVNFFSAQKVSAVMMKANVADLKTLDALVEAGKLKLHLDSRFPAEQLALAWEKSREGHVAGKIIIDW